MTCFLNDVEFIGHSDSCFTGVGAGFRSTNEGLLSSLIKQGSERHERRFPVSEIYNSFTSFSYSV